MDKIVSGTIQGNKIIITDEDIKKIKSKLDYENQKYQKEKSFKNNLPLEGYFIAEI